MVVWSLPWCLEPSLASGAFLGVWSLPWCQEPSLVSGAFLGVWSLPSRRVQFLVPEPSLSQNSVSGTSLESKFYVCGFYILVANVNGVLLL